MNLFINIHTHKTNEKDIFILNVPTNSIWHNWKYISYGIHPWDIEKNDIESQLEKIKKLCSEKKIVALGEVGLDSAIQTSLEIQKDIFIKQLEIAKQFKLPVIIHCVRAWADLLSIRKSGNYNNPWIIHGFIGNLQTAQQLIQAGCYLSFGIALIKNAKLQEVFKKLRLRSIFFETDVSELKIEEIYQKASELYDICIEELITIICINFNNVFKLPCTKTG
jgi:TatD DNase family protein